MKIPHDSIHLDTVCDEIPHDDQWNLEDPIERGYAKAGLKRFSLARVRLMVEKRLHQETNKQTLVLSKEAKAMKNSAMVSVLNPASGSNNPPAIKEEVLGWNGFQNVMCLLKSGKGL